MNTVTGIIIMSLILGWICLYVLDLNERRPFLERQTYKMLSVISFTCNISASILCMFMLFSMFMLS
jgi:hypothetical protein